MYKAVICTYCGHQAGKETAEVVKDVLDVHHSCQDCGAKGFTEVEYVRQRKKE